MAVGVTVVYNNSFHSPGNQITVTGLTGFNKLSITRIDLSGEDRDLPVRGATEVDITGATFTVTDFEAPIGKSFQYRVVADGVASGGVVLQTDTFSRTVSSGWGSSPDGLVWTLKAGTAANASVNGSVAQASITTNNDPLTLTLAPTLSDFDIYFDVSSDATSIGAQIVGSLVSHYQDESNFYRWELRFMPDSTLDVLLRRQVSGTFVNLAVHNDVVTYAPNSWYTVRCQSAAGVLSIKVYPQATTEPVDWWTTATDTTLGAGLVGLQSLTGGSNSNTKPVKVSYDNFKIPGSGGTSLITETVTSGATVAIPAPDPGAVWIKSVGQPTLSRRVNMVDFSEITRPGRILGEYEVLGRPNKVVLTDVLGGREGQFSIVTFPMAGLWESDSNTRDLQVLFQFGGTLLLQTAGSAVTGESDLFFEVKNFSRKRITPVGGELVHLHSIDFVEVDRPAVAQESLALRDWQDVLDQNDTWSNVLSNHTTWLDVLQRNL